MAQYYWAATADKVGSGVPTGMTQRFVTTNITYTVEADVDSPTGYRLRLATTVTARRGLTLDAVDSDADRATVKIRALVRTSSAGGTANYVGLMARGSGTSETAQVMMLGRDGSSRRIASLEYVSGTPGTIDVFGTTAWSDSTYVWVGLDLDGTAVDVLTSDDAGATIRQSGTDITSITAAGWVGIFSFSTNGSPHDIAVLTIATGATPAFYDDPAGDVTAPILTSPTGTATGATTANLSVTTDEANGTLYRVVTTSATAPSVAQVQAGQDHTGVAAAFSGSATVTVTGAQASTATGLTASTGYYPHFQHRDAASNDSTVASGALFTTTSGATPVAFTGTVPTQNLTESVAMTPLDLSTYFSGTETPFAYAVHTGTLQTGLSLNASTGVISGTPSEVATRAIVVRATDDATDTADTNSFDIVVASAAVKGLRVRLYDGATAQASLTGISVAMWAAQDFDATAPDFYTATATTDADGWLEVDVDAVGGVSLDDLVYTVVWKRDTVTVADSLGFQGVLTVSDIS